MEFSPCPYITEATSDIEQAKCWAKRTTQRLKQKKTYVFVYEISEDWNSPKHVW